MDHMNGVTVTVGKKHGTIMGSEFAAGSGWNLASLLFCVVFDDGTADFFTLKQMTFDVPLKSAK